ncbi:DUF1835 domain-containing protein [bacterium]|nr:DUF1835 domain-containing protein [bacterium]
MTSSSTVHILNGDALLDRFPSGIEGEKIIMRECLIDGNIKGDNLEDFFKNRTAYISSEGWIDSESEYYDKSASEINKLYNISEEANVYLWFEEDLFCQVNMWFICSILSSLNVTRNVMFVRPLEHAPYSFGHHTQDNLLQIFNEAIRIDDVSYFSKLWKAYVKNDSKELLKLRDILPSNLNFISTAIEAQVYRRATDDNMLDNLSSDVKKIIEESDTTSFAIAFQKFSKRYTHYGFGDLQFKKIYDLVK